METKRKTLSIKMRAWLTASIFLALAYANWQYPPSVLIVGVFGVIGIVMIWLKD